MKRLFPFSVLARMLRTAAIMVYALLALVCTGVTFGRSGDEPAQRQVQFPDGYRQWVHVKSGVIGPEFPMYDSEGGIHHVYANQKALSGFRSGKFEDGSILVYDLISMSTKSGIGTEGSRRRVDVMVKDSKLYSDSGGWGFGRFMGDDHVRDVLNSQVKQACYQCHQNRKDHDSVFSDFRQ